METFTAKIENVKQKTASNSVKIIENITSYGRRN